LCRRADGLATAPQKSNSQAVKTHLFPNSHRQGATAHDHILFFEAFAFKEKPVSQKSFGGVNYSISLKWNQRTDS
jgi:hypothetical protein